MRIVRAPMNTGGSVIRTGGGDMAKDVFDRAASQQSTWRREGLPDPAKIAARGIRTKESLDWMESLKPKTPAPELHIDDAALRLEATQEAQAEHRARINALREDFHQRPQKARGDFATARDYRTPERER